MFLKNLKNKNLYLIICLLQGDPRGAWMRRGVAVEAVKSAPGKEN